MVEIFLFWFIFAIVVGVFASGRGRSFFGWFLLSLFITPVLTLLLVLALKNLKEAANEPNAKTHVKCPDCRELVLKDARVCKHCGCKLIPQA